MDEYWEYVQAWWPTVCQAYRDFEERQPIILLAVDEARVYAYPRGEFKQDLSAHSQQLLEEQLKQTQQRNEIVVFVRDDRKKKLVSYTCPWKRATPKSTKKTLPGHGHGTVRKRRVVSHQSNHR
jgi:hypothetical protein